MNTKGIVLLVVLVAVIAIGAYAYTSMRGGEPAAQDESFTLAASFACDDGSYFIAEFPDADSVDIIVDGVTVRTVARQGSGEGQRFEDAQHAYVFAGEEVQVAYKATGETTVCAQPFDPNNAPVNFGDAGEGDGARQDVAQIVTETIQGRWQSVDDARFVREFRANDAVVDLYDGAVTSEGLWVAFTKENAPEVPYPLEDDAVYLQLTETGSAEDTLYFKVVKLTPEELELIYLDRGGVLRFQSVD